ncbi:hypothetical protein [Vibrio parahaemolyticus]|uniref:hypothetical protein n=1 Tax=Vibrio parahaemolyticus TaxID=670 RepID=UPI000FEC7452|nr:hypothetical protein [Vibrio parahaemolyticus]EKI0735573.1 hypothetical protein [Vibrio parahaemolyticus]MBE4408869.1 hypothetical protein [Vibrio parahaemolyticus]MCC3789395.1 hypothetical protein [Vibrio parahaemolyticus]MCX8758850.1 hypothetical protein [Vibrio parahaemolyticus]MDF4982366.1 hypothetical protein [Vibrio parahaemolyticus]
MYVNETVIDCIQEEIERLEAQTDKLFKICKQQNKDIRFVSAYSQMKDQLARLRTALKPLVSRYY